MAERISEQPGFKEIYEKAGVKERVHSPEEIRRKVEEHVKSVLSQTPAPATQIAPTQTAPAQTTTAALEKYVALAFRESLTTAVEQVRQTGSPYLIDEFHDMVVSTFMDELRSAGKFK